MMSSLTALGECYPLLPHRIRFQSDDVPERTGETAMHEGEEECDRDRNQKRPGVAGAQPKDIALKDEEKGIKHEAQHAERHHFRQFRIDVQHAAELPAPRAPENCRIVFPDQRLHVAVAVERRRVDWRT